MMTAHLVVAAGAFIAGLVCGTRHQRRANRQRRQPEASLRALTRIGAKRPLPASKPGAPQDTTRLHGGADDV